MECVSLVDGGWLFDKNFNQWTSIEYISIQDGIIVIIVLIFYDLLDLLLSEDSCKEREFGTERWQGRSDTFFQDKKCCIV